MGLNWSEGLTQVGKGLEGLQDAKEKTLELEYRNMRDKNLRRFELEDQARDDRLLGEERTYTEGQDLLKQERGDAAKGIGDSDRAGEFRDKETSDREAKHADAMEIAEIYSRNRGSKSKPRNKSEYVQQRYDDFLEKYYEEISVSDPIMDDEGNARDPLAPKKTDMDMLMKRWAIEWDQIQEYGGPTPFSPNDQEAAPAATGSPAAPAPGAPPTGTPAPPAGGADPNDPFSGDFLQLGLPDQKGT